MYIYKTTNLITGKIYVGKRVYRKKDDNWYLGSGIYLKRSIQKYGRENFKKDIIEWCTSREDLNLREIYWIKKLNATDKLIGYNLAPGGEGGNLGVDAVKKIGDSLRGKKRSKEFCAAVSKGLKGKPKSKKHIENVAKALRGKKRPSETLTKMSVAMKKKYSDGWASPVQKTVYQYSKFTGEYINHFDSVTHASQSVGVSRKAISNNCNKKTKSSGGFVWSFNKHKNIKSEVN